VTHLALPPPQARLVVLGAGPAGCLLALLAARAGWPVALLDRKSFPRPKVCGGCLAPGAIRALHQAQAAEVLARCHATPLRRLRLRVPGGELALPLPPSLAVERTALDDQLLQMACRAGVMWCPATSARVGQPISRGRVVHWHQPQGGSGTILAEAVAVACGLHTPGAGVAPPEFRLRAAKDSLLGVGVVSSCPAPRELRQGEVLMAVGEQGYVGLTVTGCGRLNAAAALQVRSVQQHGGPAAVVAQVLECCGLYLPQLQQLPWQGTPRLTRSVEPAASQRAFLLGDALGYLEPFTGQGIAVAYQQAVALWQVLRSGQEARERERRWIACSRRMMRAQRIRTGSLALALRHAGLVRRAVGVLNLCPVVAAALAHWIEQAV